jgi:hypothetical protein
MRPGVSSDSLNLLKTLDLRLGVSNPTLKLSPTGLLVVSKRGTLFGQGVSNGAHFGHTFAQE